MPNKHQILKEMVGDPGTPTILVSTYFSYISCTTVIRIVSLLCLTFILNFILLKIPHID